MKELTQEQKDLIIAEASKRAEASRPRILLKVEAKEVNPLLAQAQTEADRLTSLIPEDIRETFRIETSNSTNKVIKKREQPHTMILPQMSLESNLTGSIISGILNYYINQSIIPEGQRTALFELLTGKTDTIEIERVNKKRKSKSDKPKKERKLKVEDKDKVTLEPTGGNTIKLSDICKELNLDPKKARMKLRKAYNKPANGWEWSADQVEDIKKFLRG